MAEQNTQFDIPEELQYSDEHVWVNDEADPVVMGVTEHALYLLGKLAFVDLPEVGTHVNAGDELFTLESAKIVQPFTSPVAGTVKYVNAPLEDDVDALADDPYGEGWIVKVELDDDDQPDLLTAEQYAALVAKENKANEAKN
ncbi:glycine cleavage system protein H [Bifidobacterium dolichotidis]|uniref:Glycine cleavage system H protein n=1 Tax=Bifidobacterium dolichotidis TaxID=2306976 RepID=A0A430FRN5_9BIFI|nr:glycine cleavage system protein GcvH [Bifidobacterium dolichotidis]RSX55541.1 glycine cleavage system protein H [Bifidobacterium dolichotidis]